MLYRAALITLCGRGSIYPWRAVCLKLGSALFCALFAGHLVAQECIHMALGHFLPHTFLWFSQIMACQIAITFTLLSAIGTLQSNQQDTLTRLMHILPISARQRWFLTLIPTLVLCGLVLSFLAEPLCVLFHALGLPLLACASAVIVGTLSALGTAAGFRHRKTSLQIIFAVLTLAGEYTLLHISSNSYTSPAESRIIYLALLICFVLLSLLIVRGAYKQNYPSAAFTRRRYSGIKLALPAWAWMIQKSMRSSSMCTNIGVAMILSVLIVVLSRRAAAQFGQDTIQFIAALLAGSCAADIRSLSRALLPAEITALRGTWYFIRHEWLAAIPLCLLAVSPLLLEICLISHSPKALSIGCVHVFLGIGAGVLASTIIVPGPHDIMSNFSSAFFCAGLIIGLPYFTGLLRLPPEYLPVVQIATLLGMVFASYWVERHRNNFIWRSQK